MSARPRYPLFLAVDLGTTNVRSIIFDETGGIVSCASRELRIYGSHPQTAEQVPEEIWEAILGSMKDCLGSSNVAREDIAVLSLCAQMHGVTVIDRDGNALVPLITWLDRRAAPQSELLGAKLGSYEIYRRTGCPVLYSYPCAKILWIRQNLPRVFAEGYKFLSAKDYVVYRMLGEAYIDRSTASGSQLFDIRRLTWDEMMLKAAGLDEDSLPVLCDETDLVGEVSSELAAHSSLKNGTPIVIGASDAASSNIGLGVIREGLCAVNIGTSGAVRVASDRPLFDRSRKARFFCYYGTFGRWLCGGATSNAGILLRWFRDSFGQIDTEEALRSELDPLEVMLEKAGGVEPGADGLLFVPFLSGERFPVRDASATGIMSGLTLRHGRDHVLRSMLEGVSFTLKWIMDALEESGLELDEVRVGGGGARSAVWRGIEADVWGKRVSWTKVDEASALGAAMLGAVRIGVYGDLAKASENMVEVAGEHEPNVENHLRYVSLFERFKRLYALSKRLRSQ